jgi:hypothetical protein
MNIYKKLVSLTVELYVCQSPDWNTDFNMTDYVTATDLSAERFVVSIERY